VIANVPPHWKDGITHDHGARWAGQVSRGNDGSDWLTDCYLLVLHIGWQLTILNSSFSVTSGDHYGQSSYCWCSPPRGRSPGWRRIWTLIDRTHWLFHSKHNLDWFDYFGFFKVKLDSHLLPFCTFFSNFLKLILKPFLVYQFKKWNYCLLSLSTSITFLVDVNFFWLDVWLPPDNF